MADYDSESRALDAEILRIIERWRALGESLGEGAFNDLALRLFEYQLRYNQAYARYCARIGVTSAPASWERIPAVPAPAFKEAAIATFESSQAALVFETSGTTQGRPGRHYMQSAALYDAALLAGFERFVLGDGARLRYLNLVPNPAERPHSSLGYMMGRVGAQLGDGRAGWYLRGEALLTDPFERDLNAAVASSQPVCIAATAFGLAHLLDVLQQRALRFVLPPASRVMETGGFKGRTRVVERDELYARIRTVFGLTEDAIFSEYGMTELTSQYYARASNRAFVAPPWLRVRVVGPDRTTLPLGEIGSLLHVDLANRSSCVALQTEDIGMMTREGLVFLGRDRDAALRGCSLDAEQLRTSAASY